LWLNLTWVLPQSTIDVQALDLIPLYFDSGFYPLVPKYWGLCVIKAPLDTDVSL